MRHDERSDGELLAESRADPAALGLIYERHAPAVYRFLARRVGGLAAEDLLGEVFTVAVEVRLRVRPHESGSALPWLYGIARNVVRSFRRRTVAPAVLRAAPDLDWEAVDARLDAHALRGDLRAALAELTDSERDVLLLVAWEQLTPAEAAEALGITPEAARTRLYRARTRASHALATLTITH